MQILGTSDLQDMASLKGQEVLDQESAPRTIELENTTHDTVSISLVITSSDTSPGDLFRSDRHEIGDKENITTTNGSVGIEENCEDTTEEDSLKHEPTAEDASGEIEEWNCTIQ